MWGVGVVRRCVCAVLRLCVVYISSCGLVPPPGVLCAVLVSEMIKTLQFWNFPPRLSRVLFGSEQLCMFLFRRTFQNGGAYAGLPTYLDEFSGLFFCLLRTSEWTKWILFYWIWVSKSKYWFLLEVETAGALCKLGPHHFTRKYWDCMSHWRCRLMFGYKCDASTGPSQKRYVIEFALPQTADFFLHFFGLMRARREFQSMRQAAHPKHCLQNMCLFVVSAMTK